MDSISLNPTHKPTSCNSSPDIIDIPDDDDVAGDSSSTECGNSETEFANEKADEIMMETISTSVSRGVDVPQLLHNTTKSRANFSQFETPADETRNNFGPEDFDEQLFIGQLGTSCTENRRFDEELEPQVIMDTADHSESSDVEDMFSNGSSNNVPHETEDKTVNESSNSRNDMDDSARCFPTSPTSLQQNRLRQHNSRSCGTPSAKRKNARGQRHDRVLGKNPSSPQPDLLSQKDDQEYDDQALERLHEEDLSCDNALDSESIESHHHIPICLNLITSAEEENVDTDQSTIRSCTSADGLKSSPMRKRKGEMAVDSPDETLPLKKPVTDEDVDEYSLRRPVLISQQTEQPFDVDDADDIEDGDDVEDIDDEEVVDSPEEEFMETREEISDGQGSPYSYDAEDNFGEASPSVPSGSTIRSIIPSKTNPPPHMGDWLHIFSGWSHPERLMAITELIGLCEATQVRHMMQIIEPQFQRDFISLLPKELALYVLSFLDPRDLLRAAQTCKYWRILADDNLLWREKCKEAGIGYFSAMSNRVHRRNRNNTNAHTSTASNFDVPNTRWKAAFMKQHYVEMNWKRKDTRDHKILKGHDDHVITCLQFSGSRIVSGSDDNTLKVWSANTGKCLRTLLGHTGGVWSSQMSGTTIVSGSTDRTLRVWNAETGQCLHTLYGHTSTVRCMHLHGKKVVSGSRDATLRMWDVETGECLHVLVGHMAAVRCVQYNGHLVVSGAYDYMVRIWDPEREECLHQLSGHTNRVYSLQFDGIHVVSGSLDTSIRVWDVETGACKHTLMGHQSLTSGMELRDNLLVSGNADSTVKIWDISTGQCLLTLTGPNKHLSAVTCLQLINKFVITSSDDGTVKLWDVRTGDFVRNLVSLSSGGSGGVVWRIRASETKLVCAVGSRNGTEETKLLVLDFDTDAVKLEPKVEVKTENQLDY